MVFFHLINFYQTCIPWVERGLTDILVHQNNFAVISGLKSNLAWFKGISGLPF